MKLRQIEGGKDIKNRNTDIITPHVIIQTDNEEETRYIL